MKREDTFETLFTNHSPSHVGFRRHAETDFGYMNSHADAPVRAARAIIEGWYRNYPTAHREDVARRFRSKKPTQHSGAFWELYLHEQFLRIGYGIEVHAVLAGSDARPDFLLLKDGQAIAVVEARLAGVETDEETSAKQRKGELHDALDRVNSPNFFLQIDEVPGNPVRCLISMCGWHPTPTLEVHSYRKAGFSEAIC